MIVVADDRLAAVVWQRLGSTPRPCDAAFITVGAGCGLGSVPLGSVGRSPPVLPRLRAGGVYIAAEAACVFVMHLTKMAVYGVGALLDPPVLFSGPR